MMCRSAAEAQLTTLRRVLSYLNVSHGSGGRQAINAKTGRSRDSLSEA